MNGLNPFKKVWFWILILCIIGFIVSLSLFESMGQTATGSSTPIWIWVLFGISILLWIVALVLYSIDVAATRKRAEIAEACGELPPEPVKKKVECPKKQCLEKKIISCVEKTPCDSSRETSSEHPIISTPQNTQMPQNTPIKQNIPMQQNTQIPQVPQNTQMPQMTQNIPMAQNTAIPQNTFEDQYPSLKLKPLSALAPLNNMNNM